LFLGILFFRKGENFFIMKKTMRKGFTLVELLIVIVVIGILSAMMMLSSTEAVSSARAADIISDLRNLKTACLAYYADNLDFVEGSSFTNLQSVNSGDILKYLGNEGLKDSYSFYSDPNNDKGWYVFCHVTDSKVQEKLTSRASSVGLLGKDDNNNPPITTYNKNTYVAMKVR